MRPRRVLHSPTVEPEPFDPAAFPGLEERRRADGGAASERWRRPIADEQVPSSPMGRWARCSSPAGLQFGDPPEVWNLSQPDVIRRIHRGYLEAGSRILLTNTFGGNRHRLSLHGLTRTGSPSSTRPPRSSCAAEVDAAGGDALVAGDIGPSGAIMAPTRHARLRRGGRHLRGAGARAGRRRRRPHLDRDDVRPDRDHGRHRGRPARLAGHPADHDDDLRHPRPHDDGRLARSRPSRRWELGADAVGGNCGNGPDELVPVIERMHAAAPDVRWSPSRTSGCRVSSTCGPST